MKAVAINGSPRKGGNTEILLKKALAPLAAAGWENWNLGFGLDKGEVARDDEASRNMNDPGQTIAWLGAAIHERAGSRPPADVLE
jgi:hypothetical protein